jgi:hypothetical protein
MRDGRTGRIAAVGLVAASLFILGACSAPVKGIRVVVGHRYYLGFRDTSLVEMGQRVQVGDTDFSFEVREFYPHFMIVDSTRQVISLSDEPKNPAFRIRVFRKGKRVEDTWAFFGTPIPHYAPTSMLSFLVTEFTYRGERYRAEPSRRDSDSAAAEPRSGHH